jgi:hypothetical protein
MNTTPHRLFDAYLAIDWSSRNQPSPAAPTQDAIWVGEASYDESGKPQTRDSYFRTRQSCLFHLRDRLSELTRKDQRVFIGFDFCYGYPSGYAKGLDLKTDPPWKSIWDELARLIHDSEDNANNRFKVASELNRRCGGTEPGPLWGCPQGVRLPHLAPTSPHFPYLAHNGIELEKLRWVDRGQPRIQTIWKLCYAASVGSQVLVGIPAVRFLREDPKFKEISAVWPFETGFTSTPTPDEGPFILHVEIWPGLVPRPLDPRIPIRDQAQVRAVVEWLRELDADGSLRELFDVPPTLPDEGVKAALQEEGWIIGAGLRTIQSGQGTLLK